jgi:hypothetical protein
MSQYKTITQDEFVARFIDKFAIDGSDFIPRLTLWLSNGLRDLDIPLALVPIRKADTFTGYKYILPVSPDINCILAVYINKTRAINRGVINMTDVIDIPNFPESTDFMYDFNLNGAMIISIESGDIDIIYSHIPEYVGIANNISIYIPDNFFVIEALCWYALMQLLMRGYKHPIFEIESNNQNTNVRYIYEGIDGMHGAKRKARVAVTVITRDIREQMSQMTTMGLLINDIYNSITSKNT